MDAEKKEMMEKNIMNSRRLKPTPKEKEIVRGQIKKAFEGMGMRSGQMKLTGSKNQEMKSTIKKIKTPRENGLLNNPNITMDERKKAVREKIRKEFEGAPDLIKMLETATKEKDRKETEKILNQQEKKQNQKTFLEMISGMKLSEGTISNRVEMSDKGIYENFKNELAKEGKPFKVGSIFKMGVGEKKEEFKILGIKETGSGVKAVVLGNEKTKEVEIIFEGSNPGLFEITKDPKAWACDWGNNYRNLDSSKRKGIKSGFGALSAVNPLLSLSSNVTLTGFEGITEKCSKGSEDGTPKSYEDALRIAREVQNEYKNGKGGYSRGLTRVSGHSKGGGEAIYAASHLNLEAIVTDPAPVNNPGKYFYNNKILTVIPNNGKALLNETRRNSAGALTSLPKAGIIGIGTKMKNLPAIAVEAFKDKKKGGKLDTHKTDPDSVKNVENEILKLIKLNNRIIKGERNVRSR